MQTDNIYQVSGAVLGSARHSDFKEQLPDINLTETVSNTARGAMLLVRVSHGPIKEKVSDPKKWQCPPKQRPGMRQLALALRRVPVSEASLPLM